MKRMFDFCFAILGLVILSPIFFIVCIAIKVNDKGPIFFLQSRVGKNGKLFVLYKFRSMQVRKAAKDGIFEPGNISRITKIGNILRKYKIDELPQLYNVLKGDMSLVGPRPEVKKWTLIYSERWQHILKVKPGITDNASIEFRNEEKILTESSNPEKTYAEIILPKKLDLYETYVNNHSIYRDIKLILKTFYYLLYKAL